METAIIQRHRRSFVMAADGKHKAADAAETFIPSSGGIRLLNDTVLRRFYRHRRNWTDAFLMYTATRPSERITRQIYPVFPVSGPDRTPRVHRSSIATRGAAPRSSNEKRSRETETRNTPYLSVCLRPSPPKRTYKLLRARFFFF